MEERPGPHPGDGGPIPSLSTVAESKAAEGPACEAGYRGFESLRSPQASVAQRRPRLTVNQVSHTEVRVLPGALHVPVAQQESAAASEAAGRPFESGRGYHGAHLAGAGGRLQPCRAGFESQARLSYLLIARAAGFDPRARLHGP
jgi:hypothetical protein